MTDGVTGTSLSAGLQHKTSVARDRLCQITSNRKLLHKYKEWCEFSSHIKAKSHKMRPACTTTTFVFCQSETKMTSQKYVHVQKPIS